MEYSKQPASARAAYIYGYYKHFHSNSLTSSGRARQILSTKVDPRTVRVMLTEWLRLSTSKRVSLKKMQSATRVVSISFSSRLNRSYWFNMFKQK